MKGPWLFQIFPCNSLLSRHLLCSMFTIWDVFCEVLWDHLAVCAYLYTLLIFKEWKETYYITLLYVSFHNVFTPFYSLTQSLCNMFAASGIYHAACYSFRHYPCSTFQVECVCLCQSPAVGKGPWFCRPVHSTSISSGNWKQFHGSEAACHPEVITLWGTEVCNSRQHYVLGCFWELDPYSATKHNTNYFNSWLNIQLQSSCRCLCGLWWIWLYSYNRLQNWMQQIRIENL
jgi:hypothetical protein